jgi:3-hydroxyacyl-[acyl-carrier-protein] dehydratase
VTHLDRECGLAAAYRDVHHGEFWVKGHIPGRPLFPGVLMIEAVAQLASFATMKVAGWEDYFLGLGGVDKIKFRGTVVPDCRMILLAKLLEARSRRWRWSCQALVEDRLVFEGVITGMQV